MPGRLQDKVAVVTGSSSGIGRAICFAYSAEGACIVCADRHPDTRFDSNDEETRGTTHDRVKESGGQAIFVQVDVSVPAQVERLVQEAVGRFGRLDVMVNNAGIGSPNGSLSIWDETPENWDVMQNVNSKGVFLGIKYASKQMLKQDPLPNGDRGWIINTASVLGLVGTTGQAAYCAAKGLVVNLTRAAALECGPHMIRVNSIAPGWSKSAMTQSYFEDDTKKMELEKAHPLRSLGKPDDLAKVCVFLASEDAEWVAGVTIPVDGGYTAH